MFHQCQSRAQCSGCTVSRSEDFTQHCQDFAGLGVFRLCLKHPPALPWSWLHREEHLLKILFLRQRFCKTQSHRQDLAHSGAAFSHFQHLWIDGGREARICLLCMEQPLSMQPLGCSWCLWDGACLLGWENTSQAQEVPEAEQEGGGKVRPWSELTASVMSVSSSAGAG